jgi:dUTP pyrophosphatase
MAKNVTLVKVKKLVKEAVIPFYAKDGDAGMDLTAVSKSVDEESAIATFGTGLAFEIPKGYVGLVFPRSSSYKQQSIMSNSVGVIDSGYRGEVMCKFYQSFDGEPTYNVKDRIAQLIIIPYPQIEFVEVNELSETERNIGGYGSTGK